MTASSGQRTRKARRPAPQGPGEPRAKEAQGATSRRPKGGGEEREEKQKRNKPFCKPLGQQETLAAATMMITPIIVATPFAPTPPHPRP